MDKRHEIIIQAASHKIGVHEAVKELDKYYYEKIKEAFGLRDE